MTARPTRRKPLHRDPVAAEIEYLSPIAPLTPMSVAPAMEAFVNHTKVAEDEEHGLEGVSEAVIDRVFEAMGSSDDADLDRLFAQATKEEIQEHYRRHGIEMLEASNAEETWRIVFPKARVSFSEWKEILSFQEGDQVTDGRLDMVRRVGQLGVFQELSGGINIAQPAADVSEKVQADARAQLPLHQERFAEDLVAYLRSRQYPVPEGLEERQHLESSEVLVRDGYGSLVIPFQFTLGEELGFSEEDNTPPTYTKTAHAILHDALRHKLTAEEARVPAFITAFSEKDQAAIDQAGQDFLKACGLDKHAEDPQYQRAALLILGSLQKGFSEGATPSDSLEKTLKATLEQHWVAHLGKQIYEKGTDLDVSDIGEAMGKHQEAAKQWIDFEGRLWSVSGKEGELKDLEGSPRKIYDAQVERVVQDFFLSGDYGHFPVGGSDDRITEGLAYEGERTMATAIRQQVTSPDFAKECEDLLVSVAARGDAWHEKVGDWLEQKRTQEKQPWQERVGPAIQSILDQEKGTMTFQEAFWLFMTIEGTVSGGRSEMALELQLISLLENHGYGDLARQIWLDIGEDILIKQGSSLILDPEAAQKRFEDAASHRDIQDMARWLHYHTDEATADWMEKVGQVATNFWYLAAPLGIFVAAKVAKKVQDPLTYLLHRGKAWAFVLKDDAALRDFSAQHTDQPSLEELHAFQWELKRLLELYDRTWANRVLKKRNIAKKVSRTIERGPITAEQ